MKPYSVLDLTQEQEKAYEFAQQITAGMYKFTKRTKGRASGFGMSRSVELVRELHYWLKYKVSEESVIRAAKKVG